MQITTKQFTDANLALVDHATLNTITATFANVVLTSSDESIFTATSDVNGDGVLDIVPVNPGTATLTATADASYTDANTGQPVTVNKGATIEVTVTAPVEGQLTDLVLTLSDPQPLP